MATSKRVNIKVMEDSGELEVIRQHNLMVDDIAAVILAAATNVAAVAAVVPTAAKVLDVDGATP